VFEGFDEDGDGWLDSSEFHQALNKVGIHVSEFAARNAMDELDL